MKGEEATGIYDRRSQVYSHSSFLTPGIISWLELHGKLKSKTDLDWFAEIPIRALIFEDNCFTDPPTPLISFSGS